MSQGDVKAVRAGSLILFIVLWGCAGTAIAQETARTPSTQYASFSRGGMEFEYPGEWQEHPRERLDLMKKNVQEQLNPFGITILEFSMIVAPRGTACFMITRSTRRDTVSVQDLLKERQGVYRDAEAGGDVTRVHQLEITTVDNKPGLIEDVERSNGGRGRTVKVIEGQNIFELSLIVNDARDFLTYQPAFEHLIDTLIIKESGA
ncbi:MAG: hypothetical protein JW844_03285 [Candidatus Omnitrophica bacterium]|nr:hypothetical protein [Candidatus Omnitrophota bacterium]